VCARPRSRRARTVRSASPIGRRAQCRNDRRRTRVRLWRENCVWLSIFYFGLRTSSSPYFRGQFCRTRFVRRRVIYILTCNRILHSLRAPGNPTRTTTGGVCPRGAGSDIRKRISRRRKPTGTVIVTVVEVAVKVTGSRLQRWRRRWWWWWRRSHAKTKGNKKKVILILLDY